MSRALAPATLHQTILLRSKEFSAPCLAAEGSLVDSYRSLMSADVLRDNERKEPMGNNESVLKRSATDQGKRDFNTVYAVVTAFLLLPIEYDFILKLIDLIRGHAPLWYVSSAVVIQLGLVMAAITYRGIWRMLRSTGPSSTLDTEKLLGKIGYMVMCLLFALMTYPDFAAHAAKVIR